MSILIERYAASENQNLTDLHPVLQRIYLARGVQNRFDLKTDLASLLPFQDLKDIDRAVAVLAQALEQQQRIMIIGDYDADGATSTAIALLALRSLGFQHVDYLVPNRFEYGYGLTPEIVAVAAEKKPDLIITVDNGISSIAGVAAANERHIQVIITDHHLTAEELPAAAAIINPNQPDDKFASKHLAGCGVIFYLMLALRSYLREKNYFVTQNIAEPNMADYLDLVALGTVADVVQLDKNNRILVAQGMKRIQASHCRPGIKALATVAIRQLKDMAVSDLGFVIAPRLNAAGRLEDMSLGIECLIANDYQSAYEIAEKLDSLNYERKNIEADMREQAFKILDKLHFDRQHLPAGIVAFDESWHQGVIGLVAARIKDKYHRPTIAFAPVKDGELKGSARSIDGLHIRDALDAIAKQHPHLIEKFGGHAMAAGLSLQRENLAEFQQVFAEQVAALVSGDDLQQIIHSDGNLSVEELNLSLAQLLRAAGPWGQGFPEPLFDGEFDIIEQRIVGNKHLKLTLGLGTKHFPAIAFNVDLQQWPNYRCTKVHAAYRVDINEFNGLLSLQLLIEHLQPLC